MDARGEAGSNALGGARDALLREVARDSSVDDESTRPSEKTFIDFVAKKSQEIPAETEEKKENKEEEKKPRFGKIIRTYYSDMAETIQRQKLSLAGIAAKEEEKKEPQKAAPQKVMPQKVTPQKAPPTKKRSKPKRAPLPWKRIGLTVLSGVLIGGGIILVFSLYQNYRSRPPVEAPSPAGSLILANERREIDVSGMSRSQLLEALAEVQKTATGAPGDVINIVPVAGLNQEPLSAQSFLALLQTNIDPALDRSIEDQFMLGVHIVDTPEMFLILKTSFFENAFAGMLRWEERVADDLPFLATGSPTAQTEMFTDVVIANKDARVSNRLLYSFADPQTLVITGNNSTLRAVLERLVVSRFEQ